MAACEPRKESVGSRQTMDHGAHGFFLRREEKPVTKSSKPEAVAQGGYHCSSLDEATLQSPSPDRPFLIRLTTETKIYVDQHDYNLFVRPIEAAERKERLRTRCIIAGKRCQGDCSECPHPRTGAPMSIEEQFEKYELEYADQSEQIVERLAQEELVEALWREIGTLSEGERRILLMYADGMSTHSIAKAIGKPQRTVYDNLQSLLKKLRAKLEPYR